jgi:hypothetical protein
MALGTWRSTLPLRLGGGSTKRITQIYNGLRANSGDAFSTDEESVAAYEDKATARLLSIADRAIDRRVQQGQDPRKLSGMRLERWEDFLGLVVPSTDSSQARRRRVASRLLDDTGGMHSSASSIAANAFAPWTTQIYTRDLTLANAYWPGNGYPDQFASDIAGIVCAFVRPVTATDDDVQQRIDVCTAAFDERLPAWCTFEFGETYSGDAEGWILGVSRLGLAML